MCACVLTWHAFAGNAVDMGASIITGADGNPITTLVRQLDEPFHAIVNDCPMYDQDGRECDRTVDEIGAKCGVCE
jgi:hypothetical protein